MTISDKELPLGPPVADVTRRLPALEPHFGRSVLLEPLAVSHANELWEASKSAEVSWAYLRYGPFLSEDDFRSHVDRIAGLPNQPFFVVIPSSSGCPEGWASFCDISPANASIEIGSIWFSPRLQRTRASTEAMFFMLKHAFELGYHRVVWRCNALNAASMHAAKRLGFSLEGIWREAEIVKGRRRDTAWFSMLESEWPKQRANFEAWLADSNFDASGKALTSLISRAE